MSCPKTKHNVTGQGSNLDHSRSGDEHTNHEAATPPRVEKTDTFSGEEQLIYFYLLLPTPSSFTPATHAK